MTELLSKLAPHAKFPNGEPPGGIPAITMEDVAGACAGMSRHAYLYALAKFCLDKSVMPELRRENRRMTIHRAELDGWRSDPEKVLVLADLALSEALSPRTCKRCRGAKILHNQKQCPDCGGKGRLGANGAQCAEAMGVARQSWAQTWARRLEGVVGDLLMLEDDISRHIRRRVYFEG